MQWPPPGEPCFGDLGLSAQGRGRLSKLRALGMPCPEGMATTTYEITLNWRDGTYTDPGTLDCIVFFLPDSELARLANIDISQDTDAVATLTANCIAQHDGAAPPVDLAAIAACIDEPQFAFGLAVLPKSAKRVDDSSGAVADSSFSAEILDAGGIWRREYVVVVYDQGDVAFLEIVIILHLKTSDQPAG